MNVERRGKQRNYGYSTICSTEPDYVILVNGRGRGNALPVIQVCLDIDHEISNGGEHLHNVRIDFQDFAKIVLAVSAAASKDKSLQDELAQHFDGNITCFERIKLAVLGIM